MPSPASAADVQRPSPTDRLRAAKLIARFHLDRLRRNVAAPFLPDLKAPDSDGSHPAVTVLVTSMNQRPSLEVTLRTLFARAGYAPFEVWVADNGSTDGSGELVADLAAAGWPVRLIQHGERRPQHEWYDYMLANATTPYWVAVHEDMCFTGDGWLRDLVAHLELHRNVDMLGGEYFPPSTIAEPVNGEIVDLQESLSTWIFAVRTPLREHVSTSFAYYKEWDERKGRTQLFDQGGKLIADMRERGLRFECMPPWYRLKFHHTGNLSWAFDHPMNPSWRALKVHQMESVARHARRLARKQARVSLSPV